MKRYTNCGTKNKEEDRFCKKCGTALERSLSHLRNGCLGLQSERGEDGV
jgi:uncharacterized membrane protein YvbJ